MTATFLGTGTSQGVPVIGCACEVCLSSDKKDKRLRSSIIFSKEDFNLLIDVSPDLRYQLLRIAVDKIDAICVTHEHNDHVNGIDDLRPVNFKWNQIIPLYAQSRVISELQNRFYYAFSDKYAARPRVKLNEVCQGDQLQLGPFQVSCIPVQHGALAILGYRIDDFVYLTDVQQLSPETIDTISDCKYLTVSALHKKQHASHQSLDQALELIEKINPQQAYITHIAHQMGLDARVNEDLPPNVSLAFDGLQIKFQK